MAKAPAAKAKDHGGAKRLPYLAREKKKPASLAGWRSGGTQDAAAKAGTVHARTIARWLRSDPEYAAAAKAALDEFIADTAQLAHSALRLHIERAIAAEPRVRGKRTDAKGAVTTFYETPELNPALAKLALVRHDPRYSGAHKELLEELAETTAEFYERKAREAAEAEARGEAPPPLTEAQRAMHAEAKENVVRLRAESGKA